jgi:type II secretory pathway pseudopilin PulG
MKLTVAKKFCQASTMVEVIIGIMILAVVGGAVLGSFKYGFFVMDMARQNQRATQIMLAKAEAVRLYNWDQVTSNGFIPTRFTNFYDEQAAAGHQGTPYYGWVAVTNYPQSTSYKTNMRQLTITLQWTTQNINRKRVLSTYIAKDGIQNYVY